MIEFWFVGIFKIFDDIKWFDDVVNGIMGKIIEVKF